MNVVLNEVFFVAFLHKSPGEAYEKTNIDFNTYVSPINTEGIKILNQWTIIH